MLETAVRYNGELEEVSSLIVILVFAVEFTVTCPVDPEMVILVPATIEVTMPVKFAPLPLKLDDVMMPEVLIDVVEVSADAIPAVVE